MSKLEELINKLCPNGVEFKPLCEVANLTAGDRIIKSMMEENMKYPVYGGGVYPTGKYNYFNFENSITISRAGSAGFVNWVEGRFWATDVCFVASKKNEMYNIKYIYYYVKNKQHELQRKIYGGNLPKLNKDYLWQLPTPVPPLEVQCEIVRILDNFTLLSAELSAELSARQKQYNFYRENLLTNDFEKNVKLKDLCDIKGRIGFRGYTRNDLVEEGQGAISFSPGNIINETINYNNCTYISWKKYEESPEIMINNGDIILCKTGSTLGKVAMVKNLPEKATLNPQLVVLKNLKCNSTYLKYIIGGYDFQYAMQAKKGLGSVPNISQKDIGNIEIRLHSPENQEKIASILDKFDKLCNDLSEGLPAEIEARKKQYEYYRDKLLTFKELK